MSIWRKIATPEQLNQFSQNSLVGLLGIEVTEIGEDWLSATMPVNAKTHQPLGFLHGGASVVLAETLGSLASHLAAEENTICFGLEVNANHIKSVKDGFVTGIARPIRVGTSTQVWDIQISDEHQQLVCVSRLTVAVKPVR